MVITADALHAQREHATWLRERGAHYLVTVKANQPGLLRQLGALPWKDVPAGHSSEGRGHGDRHRDQRRDRPAPRHRPPLLRAHLQALHHQP